MKINRTVDAESRTGYLEKFFQLIVLAMGARCAEAGRCLPPGADGMAYLDLARSYAHNDWHTAINGYWSPLYSWLLAIFMWCLHPPAKWELAAVQTVNLLIFAAALFTFSKFWNSVRKWSRQKFSKTADWSSIWLLLGYLLFLVDFIWSVSTINPDILVAVIVFAIADVLFKLDCRSQHSARNYVRLGVLLAAGYYAKTILFYFAIFVLAALVIRGYRTRRLRPPLVSGVVFAILVTPMMLAVSHELGHVTAGDSGKLNYSWFVNGTETKTWMHEPVGAPLPFYPGAIAFSSPRVFRDPAIRGIAYAPWYDAARFDQRARPTISLRDQFRQLAINLRYSREELLGAGAALTVPLLFLAWNEPTEFLRRLGATWFCTLPVMAVFGMYLLVHLVERFVLGFSLVLWGCVWTCIAIPAGYSVFARRVILAGVIVFAAYSIPGIVHYLVSSGAASANRDIEIAQSLRDHGVNPGDEVASIGDGQEAYWAHLAGVPVVSEVWSIDEAQFWSAEPATRQSALQAMADAGATVAVWRADTRKACPQPWVPLQANSGCILALR